jgi:hypothetical protein
MSEQRKSANGEDKAKQWQHTERVLQAMASALDDILESETGKKMGFVLLVFQFDAVGLANYISNAQRPDMIKSLRETADRLEAWEDIPGRTTGTA